MGSRLRRGGIATVLLILVSLAVTACGSSSASSTGGNSSGSKAAGVTSNSIALGASTPLTGAVANFCDPLTNGAQAWFNKINAAGGIDGRKINYTVLDDQYTAPLALQNARTLAAKPVFAFFGGCGTVQPPEIQQVAKPANTPYVLPYASLASASNAFSILPTYAQQLSSLVKWTFAKYGPGSVYMFNVTIPGASQTASAVASAVKAGGGKMVGTVATTPGQENLTPLIVKEKSTHPDYVIMAETAEDAVRYVDLMSQQNAMPSKKIVAMSTLAASAFTANAGSAGDGVIAPSPVAPWGTPAAKSCDSVFVASTKPKVTSDGPSLFGCATAQILTYAIQHVGKKLTQEGLIKELESFHSTKISSVIPPLTFTSTDHEGETSMFVTEVEAGALKSIGTIPISN